MIANQEKRTSYAEEIIWPSRWSNPQNRRHWHEEIEIAYCECGVCSIETENGNILLKEKEAVFIDSGVIHKIDSTKGTIVMNLLIDREALEQITKTYELKYIRLKGKYDFPSFYKEVKEILDEKKPFYASMIYAKVLTLLTTIFQTEEIEKKDSSKKNKKYELIKNIYYDIEKDYKTIKIQDLCTQYGYSLSHFSRLFQEMFDISFTEYITIVKIEHALLQIQAKEKSIGAIAMDCGFSSIRNFNRVFKEYTGYTPSKVPSDYTFTKRFIKSGEVENFPLELEKLLN